MSLRIRTDHIIEVLLVDGWHKAINFDVDAYEYIASGETEEEDFLLLGGGDCEGVPSTGFSFTEHGTLVNGPLTSVLAVRLTIDRK